VLGGEWAIVYASQGLRNGDHVVRTENTLDRRARWPHQLFWKCRTDPAALHTVRLVVGMDLPRDVEDAAARHDAAGLGSPPTSSPASRVASVDPSASG
jgi:hypothetical protein